MTNPIRRAVVIGLAAASLAMAPRAEGAEPQEISRKLSEIEARIPGEFDPAEEERRTRTMADKAELGKIELKHDAEIERELLDDGHPSGVVLHRIEVSGRAPFDKIHQFLIYRGSLTRLVELEKLHLKAEDGGAVSFEAVFVFPRALPHEAAPDTKVDRRELIDQMLSDLTARSNPTRWVEALAAFGRAMEDRTMALTEVYFGDERLAMIEGKVSNGSRDRLKPAFEKAGFRVLDVQMSPAGNCQTVSIAVVLEAGDQQEKTTRGADPFKTGPVCD